MFGGFRQILILVFLTFVAFLLSSKNYQSSFDTFLNQVKNFLEKNSAVLLVLVLLLGLILRLIHLQSRELWYDEAFSALLVRRSWSDMLSYIVLRDVHPPFYYILLKSWSSLVGYSALGLRSLSLIFGIGLVWLVYKFGTEIFKSKVLGLSLSLIFALNPFLINYSQEIRAYSLVSLMACCLLYVLYKRKWVYFSIILSLMLVTHYMNFFMFPGLLLVFLILIKKDKKIIRPFLISCVLPLLLSVFWLPTLLRQFRTGQTELSWIPKTRLFDLFKTFKNFLFYTQKISINSIVLFILLFSAAVFFFYKIKKENKVKALILSSVSIFPIILIFLTSYVLEMNIYIDRVLIGYLSIFLIFIVFVFSKLTNYLSIFLISLYFILNIGFQFTRELEYKGYDKLAKYAKNSSKLLVMTNPMHYSTLKYYAYDGGLERIKLQKEAPKLAIINEEDIVIKENISEPFYLVNNGPIKGWDYDNRVGEFYFYLWEN